MKIEQQLLSPKEVATILGISVKTIYSKTQRKAKRPFPIPFIKMGRLIKFYNKDVQYYMEKRGNQINH